jgi:D-alanine transaminase
MTTLPDTLCYLNGEYLPLNEAKVSACWTAASSSATASTTSCRSTAALFRFDEHMARLERGLAKIRIPTRTRASSG